LHLSDERRAEPCRWGDDIPLGTHSYLRRWGMHFMGRSQNREHWRSQN